MAKGCANACRRGARLGRRPLQRHVGAAREKEEIQMATAAAVMESNVKIGPTKLLINGKWVNSVSGKTFPTINPSTGEVTTQVAEPDEQAGRSHREARG